MFLLFFILRIQNYQADSNKTKPNEYNYYGTDVEHICVYVRV